MDVGEKSNSCGSLETVGKEHLYLRITHWFSKEISTMSCSCDCRADWQLYLVFNNCFLLNSQTSTAEAEEGGCGGETEKSGFICSVSLVPTALFMDFFALRYLHWSGFRTLTLTLLTAVSLSSSWHLLSDKELSASIPSCCRVPGELHKADA